MNVKGIREGEEKSNAGAEGGANPCDFQVDKHIYSNFREIGVSRENTSPSCTLVIFLLELASLFHVGQCSQQTLGPD